MIRLNSPWSGENGDWVRNWDLVHFLPKPLLYWEQAAAKMERGDGGLQAELSFASQLGQTRCVVFHECTQTISSEAQTSPWKHPPKPGSSRAKELVSNVFYCWSMKELQAPRYHSGCQW